MPEVQSDFTATIHSVYNQFTRAEKKVADYAIAHSRDVLFMSITELADAVGEHAGAELDHDAAHDGAGGVFQNLHGKRRE